jgi:hypothetical protein
LALYGGERERKRERERERREREKTVGIRMEPGKGVLPVGKRIKAPARKRTEEKEN